MSQLCAEEEMVAVRIGGVMLYLGEDIRAEQYKTMRLGRISVKYLMHDGTTEKKLFVVLASLQDVVDRLSMSGVRHIWEKEFRREITIVREFVELSPRGATDIYAVRLNPTIRLDKIGWKDNTINIKDELIRAYRVRL